MSEDTLASRGRLLTTREASALTGIAVGTYEWWRHTGRGPPFVKLGGRFGPVRYAASDLWAWIDAHRVTTSDEAPT